MSIQRERSRRLFNDPTAHEAISNVQLHLDSNPLIEAQQPSFRRKRREKSRSPFSKHTSPQVRAQELGRLSNLLESLPGGHPDKRRIRREYKQLVALQTEAKNKTKLNQQTIP